MELLSYLCSSIVRYFHTPSETPHSSPSRNSSSYDQSKHIIPSLEDRVKLIFEILYQHEDFKNLWEDVNAKLHEPIQLIPSTSEDNVNYVQTAIMRPMACPKPPGSKCHTPSRFPHSVQIYVGIERPESEIFRSIIFETCNVKSWPKHKKLHVQVKKDELTEDQFIRSREEIEWQALLMAKQIADKIDPEICKDIPTKQIEDFEYHLSLQQNGHVEGVRKQYRKLKEHSPPGSPQVSRDSPNTFRESLRVETVLMRM